MGASQTRDRLFCLVVFSSSSLSIFYVALLMITNHTSSLWPLVVVCNMSITHLLPFFLFLRGMSDELEEDLEKQSKLAEPFDEEFEVFLGKAN